MRTAPTETRLLGLIREDLESVEQAVATTHERLQALDREVEEVRRHVLYLEARRDCLKLYLDLRARTVSDRDGFHRMNDLRDRSAALVDRKQSAGELDQVGAYLAELNR